MVAVVVFWFSGMRCQPLRRALVSIKKNHQKLRF
ncbi:general secretion pathway protein GspI, partial [Vibrio cholerae]|nr:general secretion pathway protein GspI [Vibrio cholerae]